MKEAEKEGGATMTISTKNNTLGKVIKQRRLMAELTLSQLSSMSGISISHLGRIERGERLPSASIVRKMAKPLGLSEVELFSFAGYLSPQASGTVESAEQPDIRQLDPYVATLLASESPAMQRTIVGILTIMKEIANTKS